MDRIRARIRRALDEPLPAAIRDRAAAAIAVAAFAVGGSAFAFGSVDPGVFLAGDGEGRIVVEGVEPNGPAARSGIAAGMIVVEIDGRPLVVLPGHPIETPPDPELAPGLYRFLTLTAVQPWALDDYVAGRETEIASYWGYEELALDSSGAALVIGLGIAVIGLWWLGRGRGGETLRGLAVPIVVAIATPLFLVPALLTWNPAGIAAVAAILPLGMLPLADGLAGLIGDAALRRSVRTMALVFAVGAIVAGLLVLDAGLESPPSFGQWLLAGAVAFVPGFVASRPAATLAGGTTPSGRVVESIELAAVGATPFVATATLALSAWGVTLVPILLWIAALLAAQRFTVRPLARLATRVQLQRDLVVAATEAERSRIAANIHDDALQDLTLLVRRLDARGDAENAEAARQVAERLRTISGELRLPILDDLGAGPALEWLVERMERLAGGEVRLERDDGSRPPPDVELAFFRVAQEALANAVKHGRPPIVVRYRVSESGASLSIDDAGPGIGPEAIETAQRAGRLGLLGMQQRAEQIGAILDVRRWPGGGTHVALEWRPR